MFIQITLCAWQANSKNSTGCVRLNINLLKPTRIEFAENPAPSLSLCGTRRPRARCPLFVRLRRAHRLPISAIKGQSSHSFATSCPLPCRQAAACSTPSINCTSNSAAPGAAQPVSPLRCSAEPALRIRMQISMNDIANSRRLLVSRHLSATHPARLRQELRR